MIDLYQWSEGLRPSAGLNNGFFPGYGMETLSEILDMYRELHNASVYPRFRVGDWQWFPVFRSGGTDFYGVCCANSSTADGEVVDDDNDNEGEHRDCITPPVVIYVSLEAMLRTLLRSYETGVYYLDEDGRLRVGLVTYFDDGPLEGYLKSVDISKFKEVAKQFNPNLKCWQ